MLREELRQYSHTDPTWEQLSSELPYLDAVVHETLRMHPPVEEISRVVRLIFFFSSKVMHIPLISSTQAGEDDVIPLSSSIQTASGQLIDSLLIPKGTSVSLPAMFFNRSETFWGPDSKQFNPERWLSDLQHPAKDIHGHRHLYTFADGPRICLGRGFALAEFKVIVMPARCWTRSLS